MVDPKEVIFYKRICSNLNRETDFSVHYIDYGKLYERCKERVEAASRVEQIDFKLSKYFGTESWKEKAASEALIEIEGKTEEEIEEIHSLKNQRKAALKCLKFLLKNPLPEFDVSKESSSQTPIIESKKRTFYLLNFAFLHYLQD